MKLKKFIAVLGVAAMMTGLLAGCGNSADEGNADGGNTDGGSEAAAEWDSANDITIVFQRRWFRNKRRLY